MKIGRWMQMGIGRVGIREGWIVLFLWMVKLWLIADLDIVAGSSGHDQQWMIRKAVVQYWGDTAYDQQTYIKEPLMPLFLAGCRAVGIPARLGLEVFLGFAAWMISRAISRRDPSWSAAGLRILIFTAVLFYPPTAGLFCQTVADPLYVCLGLLGLAAAIRIVTDDDATEPAVRERMPNGGLHEIVQYGSELVVLALIAVAMAVTRPEIEFVIGLLGIWGVIWLVGSFGMESPKRTVLGRAVGVGGVFLLFGLGVTGVKAVQYVKAGFWGISEQTEKNYNCALKAMRSVPSETPSRYVWIDNATLKRVAAVSPAVAEVEPFLTGPLMGWANWASASDRPAVEAIGPGWFCWALRDAVQMAGQAGSPRQAAQFYRRIADEISIAQKRGQLPRQSVLQYYLGYQPVVALKDAGQAMTQFILQAFWPRWRPRAHPLEDRAAQEPSVVQEFDEGAGRRVFSGTALSSRSRLPPSVKGWFMEKESGHRLAEVWVISSNRVGAYARPDVGSASGWTGTNQQWGFRMTGQFAPEFSAVIFRDETGQEYGVDGATFWAQKPNTGMTLVSRDGAHTATCWFDPVPVPETRWTRYYRQVQHRNQIAWRWIERIWRVLMGLAALAVGWVYYRSPRPVRRKIWAVAALGFGVMGLRYFMLTVVDVWSFDTHHMRYSAPVDIWALPLLILLILAARTDGNRDQTSSPS